MALDTVAAILRSLAEFALEQEGVDTSAFQATAEAWARHVSLASPPPGAAEDDQQTRKGRREWEGVRRFVRGYLSSSLRRMGTVTADLRQVIWVFIRSISQSFAEDEQTDARLLTQMNRLEQLVAANAIDVLKREVTDAVRVLKQVIKERDQRQHERMQFLGSQLRTLGSALECARRESETDPLTRVPNRKAFDEYLVRTVEMHKAFGLPMSLLIVDVDHFKTVNDTHGHMTGDELLRRIADALVTVFLRKTDFVARMGGDEFAVILRETSEADARTLAERVIARVHNIPIVQATEPGKKNTASVSIGLALIKPPDDEKTWVERADRALYLAKQAGRDRVATPGQEEPAKTDQGQGPRPADAIATGVSDRPSPTQKPPS
jgi:diguanylate cyclase (GGDEF)-like protein